MQATVRLALSFQPRMRPDSVDYGQGETCQSGSSAEEESTRSLPDMREQKLAWLRYAFFVFLLP